MAGEDANSAISLDDGDGEEYPAIVDAETAEPTPPDMVHRDLSDLYKTISANSWSVPVEGQSGLDRCVQQATAAMEAGADDTSERCQHFYQQVLTMAFERLMTEKAVKGWNIITQKNVFQRTEQFIVFYVSATPPPRCAPCAPAARLRSWEIRSHAACACCGSPAATAAAARARSPAAPQQLLTPLLVARSRRPRSSAEVACCSRSSRRRGTPASNASTQAIPSTPLITGDVF